MTRNVLNHQETVELTQTIQAHADKLTTLKSYDAATEMLNSVLTFKATKDNVRNRCRSLRIFPDLKPNRFTPPTGDYVTRSELDRQLEAQISKLRAEFQEKLNAGRVVYTN